MADNGSDSDFDDDEFGNDVSTVATAQVVFMKRYSDVIDQIGPLYHTALTSQYYIVNS
jgi:hypothetical protein